MGLLNYLYKRVYGSNKVERKYGWKKGEKYSKHCKMLFTVENYHSNIKLVDLRGKCPDVYDQGKLGSCTANSLAFCYHFDELLNRESNRKIVDNEDTSKITVQVSQKETNVFVPSRLFIYYNERNLEGTVNKDAGAEIHDGIQVMNTIGVCPETDWVYDISKFAVKPDEKCYTEAQNHKTILYNALDQNLDQLKACLISGFPVAFGFVVYQSFESDYVKQTGQVPMPEPGEKVLGGHAVALVGFDDKQKVFIVRNSWGSSWGDRGYFYMPYEYVLNQELASDFWTIKKTED
jgi:C1A family cysteine protease